MVQRIGPVPVAIVLALLTGCATPHAPPVVTVVNTVEYIPVPPECVAEYPAVQNDIVTNGDLLTAYKAQEQEIVYYKTRLQCVKDSQKPKEVRKTK
jgi:hypothetical protein